jgi:outer membrane protein OmpA-like peptidoglycan-associated protein
LLGALRLMTERFMGQLAAGPGLAGGITEPAWRVLGSITWLPPLPPPPDRDKDGIPDARDQCVAEPEDIDGFQDDDGCPDLDNDGDGVPDRQDRCPNLAEDDDKFEQEDGCPEPDNDQDGILDAQDACPDLRGSPSNNPAVNGCPDRDGDGIADAQDACPDAPGVSSTEPGKNGCPAVVDRDGDGVFDADDACPEAAGPRNADPAMNGCPRARIEGGQIKILERVEFVTGSAELASTSGSILEAVQTILASHPEVTRVTVEGHTDSVGSEAYNQALSQRRAQSVKRWLSSHGVDAARLDARGYGESQPIDSNETPEGRTRNRRVEFHIMDGKPVPPAP